MPGSAYPGGALRFTIGGSPAAVEFAGAVGPGLYQFNIVAPDLASGDYPIVGEINGVQTQTGAFVTIASAPPPSLASMSPSSGQAGSTVESLTINGQNLAGVNTVTASPSAGLSISILNVTDTAVTVRLQIASNAASGSRSVTVANGARTSNSLTFTVTPAPPPPPSPPVITSISPATAEVSEFVLQFSAAGQNLGSAPQVSFNPSQGISIIGRRATGWPVLQIANDAQPGKRQVTVTTAGLQSNALPFTILPRSGNFTISNLRVTTPSGDGSFSLTVDFNDPSGAAGGGVNYIVNVPDLGFTAVSASPQGVVTGRTSGSIRLDLSAGRSVSRVGAVQVNLVNPAGHRSNTLEGVF
jgi:hypothetical protein